MYALDGADVSLHTYLPRSPQWKSSPPRDSINRRILDDIRRHSIRVRRALIAGDYDAWHGTAKEFVYTIIRLAEWEHAWAAEDGAVDYGQAVPRLGRIRDEWMGRVSARTYEDAHAQLGGSASDGSASEPEPQSPRTAAVAQGKARHGSHSRWPADGDAGTPWVASTRHTPRSSDARPTTAQARGAAGTEHSPAFTPPSPPRSARSAVSVSPGSSSAALGDGGADRSGGTRRRGRHGRRASQPVQEEASHETATLMNVVRDLTQRLRSPSVSSRTLVRGAPPLENTLQDLSRVLNQLNDVSGQQSSGGVGGRAKRTRKRHSRPSSQ